MPAVFLFLVPGTCSVGVGLRSAVGASGLVCVPGRCPVPRLTGGSVFVVFTPACCVGWLVVLRAWRVIVILPRLFYGISSIVPLAVH